MKDRHKEDVLQGSNYINFWKRPNYSDRKLISGSEAKRKKLTAKGHKEYFWGDGIVLT